MLAYSACGFPEFNQICDCLRVITKFPFLGIAVGNVCFMIEPLTSSLGFAAKMGGLVHGEDSLNLAELTDREPQRLLPLTELSGSRYNMSICWKGNGDRGLIQFPVLFIFDAFTVFDGLRC